MDYLKTLGISELLTYLEIESEPANFKKVENILSSREKNTTKRAEDLEKNMKMHKDKCSELSTELEKMKKMSVAVQSKLNEFKECKVVCNKLEEKVTRLEHDCNTISEKEKRAVQNVSSLLKELERVTRIKNEEVTEFKTKYKDLECAKRIAEYEIEVQKRRCKELEKTIQNTITLERDLESFKFKCSELSIALEDKNKKCTALEGKLEEFKEYKVICSELKERVNCLEQDCKIVSEKEKKAIQNVASLSTELEQVKRNTNKELMEYKTKNKDLECATQKAENEIEAQEKRYKELEKMMKDANELEKDLEMYKGKCSELLMALEEMNKKNIAVESKLEELKKELELYKGKCSNLSMALEEMKNKNIALEGKLEEYKGICVKLNEKIACVEEDCKIVSVREKNAIQNINNLSTDLENLSRKRNEELIELKTKNKDLECEKTKVEDEIEAQKNRYKELEKTMKNSIILENDLEIYKAKCSELSTALEEKKKESISVEGKLEKCKKYKTICNKLQKKVRCLEEECKIVREREKSASARFKYLLGDLEKLNGDRNRELNELKAKGTNLICTEHKEENEIKVQKKRSKKLKTQTGKGKGETSDLICESQVSAKAPVKVGTDVSNKEGTKDDEKQQRETIGGVNSAYSPKLKIKLKTPNSSCDGKVPDSAGADSVCHSVVKASGAKQVSTFKRKRKLEIVRCAGEDDDHIQLGKLKVEPKKLLASEVHHSDSSGNQSTPVSKSFGISATSIKKSESPIAENTGEKEKMGMRQSKRNIHPPDRLNL